ncbi:MAG: oligosaccharide flippase family protein [Candidatus Fermentibacteraceae bacterium]|nr:oligosaccharide flippase family protein [Candidatus Fermentibacteraceae bacterium]
MFTEILKFKKQIIELGVPALVSRGTLVLWGLVAILIVRVLPEETYAAYALARSVQLFGVLFGGGFILQAIIKFSAEGDTEREQRLANAGIVLASGMAVITALLLLFGGGLLQSFYSDIDMSGIPQVLALFVIVSTASQLPRSLLVAKHRMKEVMIADLASFAVRTGAVGWMILTGSLNSPLQVFGAMIAGNAAALLINVWLARDLVSPSLGISPGKMRIVMGFAVVSLGTGLANFVYTRTDILVLGKLALPSEVAGYGACRTLTAFVINLSIAANMILLPLISRMWRQGNRDGILKRVLSGILIIELIQLPVVLLYTVFSKPLLHVLYQGKYDFAWPVMIILGSLSVIRPFGSLFSVMSLGMGKPSYSMYSVLVSAGINLVLNFLLIPKYGAFGAAIATSAAVICGASAVIIPTIRYWNRNRFA